jgi:hypothetical protein
MPKELAVALDPALAGGLECRRGSLIRIPIQIRSRDIDNCTVRVTSDDGMIAGTWEEILLGGGQVQLMVVETAVGSSSQNLLWVRVDVAVDGATMQTVGFLLRVAP